MPNINVRIAIEKADRLLNQAGEQALHYSGIRSRDAAAIKFHCQDIIKTAQQIIELAKNPI